MRSSPPNHGIGWQAVTPGVKLSPGRANPAQTPGADEGAVSAEAGAKGQGPGEGADRDSFDLVDHLHHHRHHGRCEGDVVHECLEDV